MAPHNLRHSVEYKTLCILYLNFTSFQGLKSCWISEIKIINPYSFKMSVANKYLYASEFSLLVTPDSEISSYNDGTFAAVGLS